MILDIRYHIASLVAVFLALGLGILIGASLLDEGRLLESQEKLIVGLEKRFDTLQAERSLLQTENTLLSGQLKEQEDFFAALESPLVEGALSGLSVSVVYGNERWQESWQAALDALLDQAGARRVTSRLITGLLPGTTTLGSSGGDSETIPSESNSESWALNLQALADHGQGLLGERGLTPASTSLVDILLLVGTGGDSTALWEQQLTKEAAEAGIVVAIVGTPEMETHLNDLAQRGALAVDNLETVAGRIALIRGIKTGEVGYYGLGKSAKGPWPPLSSKRPS